MSYRRGQEEAALCGEQQRASVFVVEIVVVFKNGQSSLSVSIYQKTDKYVPAR